MNVIYAVIMFLFPFATTFRYKQRERKCEEVRAPICLNEVHTGYNSTYFPNHLHHRSQVEAIMELNTFAPLIKVGCSKHLATFLCSLYIPYCYPGFIVLPCRALCLHAMLGCKPIMERYNFNWNFNCSKYPDSSESNMCLGSEIKVSENKVQKRILEGKDKIRAKKAHTSLLVSGWVIGQQNETLHLLCPEGKFIHIRKVRTSPTSGCCPKASKSVIVAMCSGTVACKVVVSKNTLGAHCKKDVSKLSIRYKCVEQVKEPGCTGNKE